MQKEILKVESLNFSYRTGFFFKKSQSIISELSFSLNSGECLAIIGPNGSGKTTLLSLIAGIYSPFFGTIKAPLHNKIGYMPQKYALFSDLSVEDNLRFFAELARNSAAIRSINLQPLPFGLEKYRKVKAGKLSGGTSKRLSLACALACDPELLILDEPCDSLDPIYRSELIDIIKKSLANGCAVIYAGHDVSEFLDFFDRLLCLGSSETGSSFFKRDEIPASTPEELRKFHHELILSSVKKA